MVCALALCLVTFFLVACASMNSSNKQTEETKEVLRKEPVFSKASGFYSKEVTLSMEAEEGTKIYYTLDSTTPTVKSSEYQGEILLKDPSSEPNRYAYTPEFSPYRTEPAAAGEPQVAPGYYARYESLKKEVDKCVVVRAIAVDADGNTSPVKTATYFIDYEKKSGYTGISVLSVVTDPDGLFGDENGIMVNGKKYKEALASGKLNGITDTHILREYTNAFTGRGRDWEREVHVDYFAEGGQDLTFSQEAGIRLHGNQSRVAEEQKSFNLYARKEYDGNKTFLSPFYGDGILSDRITLMKGDDILNYYLSDAIDDPDAHSQKYTMTQLFIDGEYWGLYAIQERYNSKEYMKTRYGLAKGEYSLFSGQHYGFDYKKGDKNATKTSLHLLRDYIQTHDLSDEKEYKKLSSMMDVDSFIRHYALHLYINDQDWSWHKNLYIMLHHNKWYWLPYDLDYGAGSHDNSKAYINSFTCNRLTGIDSLRTDPFFPYLIKNKDFCNQFIQTFLDFSNEIFRKDLVEKDKKAFLSSYKDAIAKSVARYPGQEREGIMQGCSCYEACWNNTVSFFAQRPDYAISQLKDYFGIAQPLVKVIVKVNDCQGGSIHFNSICPNLGEKGSWSGSYFANIPVKLTAKPKDGWKFVGWQCEGGKVLDDSNPSTSLTFESNVTVTAIFENMSQN